MYVIYKMQQSWVANTNMIDSDKLQIRLDAFSFTVCFYALHLKSKLHFLSTYGEKKLWNNLLFQSH